VIFSAEKTPVRTHPLPLCQEKSTKEHPSESNSCPTSGSLAAPRCSAAFGSSPPDFCACVRSSCQVLLGAGVGGEAWRCCPHAGFAVEQSVGWVVTAGVGSLGQGCASSAELGL